MRDGYTEVQTPDGRTLEVLTGGDADGLPLLFQPWGFDVASIRVPTLVYQGREDAMVPFAHGEWLAAHVPGTEAHLSDDDGHLTWMISGLPRILADLKRVAGL